jgi:hypothetical protein
MTTEEFKRKRVEALQKARAAEESSLLKQNINIDKSAPTAFQASTAAQTSTKPSPMLIYGIIGGLVLVYFLTKKKK